MSHRVRQTLNQLLQQVQQYPEEFKLMYDYNYWNRGKGWVLHLYNCPPVCRKGCCPCYGCEKCVFWDPTMKGVLEKFMQMKEKTWR